MLSDYEKSFRDFLLPMVNEKRLALLEKILAQRTRYLCVVLEDIYQPQNASAVLRTCDCFGIQDVHIIENRNQFEINPEVELGAAQWLTLHRYNSQQQNTIGALKNLKRHGYRIVATSPHADDVPPVDFDLSKGKAALLFGTELNGLSDIAMDMADEYIRIPMAGFTESFNISVSAAIVLYELNRKLRDGKINWKIESSEKEYIMYHWIRNSVNNVLRIEQGFKKRMGS